MFPPFLLGALIDTAISLYRPSILWRLPLPDHLAVSLPDEQHMHPVGSEGEQTTIKLFAYMAESVFFFRPMLV